MRTEDIGRRVKMRIELVRILESTPAKVKSEIIMVNEVTAET